MITYDKRPTGCESTSHDHDDCRGELWQCEKCGKQVCWADGTDNDPELCDSCWNEKHKGDVK